MEFDFEPVFKIIITIDTSHLREIQKLIFQILGNDEGTFRPYCGCVFIICYFKTCQFTKLELIYARFRKVICTLL